MSTGAELHENVVEDDSLLLTTFSRGSKKMRLEFTDGTIYWDDAQPPYARKSLPLRNVIAVRPVHVGKKKRRKKNDKTSSPSSPEGDRESVKFKQFELHYSERRRSRPNEWKCKSMRLGHQEAEVAERWVYVLRGALSRLQGRPKKLLLFVNPFGGKRNAMKIFERHAKPLFKLAEIDVSVMVSQEQNQIRDLVQEYNLEPYDAVGCVGGDGTLAELFNGLVMRECKTRGIDPDDPDCELPRPRLPVGIIPGGSTDTTAYCVYGTTDPKSAVLHIVRGGTVGLDLVSVHDGDRGLLRLYADVLSYGYLGDIAYFSEEFRWMGPSRYEYTGVKKMLQNSGYEGEIDILVDSSEQQTSAKCYEGCVECSSSSPKEDDAPSYTWQTLSGKFFMISFANLSCAGKRNPNGLAPYSHLGDGHVSVIVIYHTSFLRSLKIFSRLTSETYHTDDLPEIDMFKAKEVRFRASPSEPSSYWSCDGETLTNLNLRARVNRQLVTLYGTGPVKTPPRNGCCRSP